MAAFRLLPPEEAVSRWAEWKVGLDAMREHDAWEQLNYRDIYDSLEHGDCLIFTNDSGAFVLVTVTEAYGHLDLLVYGMFNNGTATLPEFREVLDEAKRVSGCERIIAVTNRPGWERVARRFGAKQLPPLFMYVWGED